MPNVLSGARLALAAVFPLVRDEWRLALVVAAGLSDWLDGLIARRFAAGSAAGALLDGLADKLFAFSALVTLTVAGVIAPWQLPLILLRDLTVGGVAAYAAILRDWPAFTRMVPRPAGKLTTVLVFAWLIALLAPLATPLRVPLFIAAAGCSAVAAGEYLWKFGKALKQRRRDRGTKGQRD